MKRTVKVIGLFLVAILCISLFANLFDIGSDEPTGPGTIVQNPPADTDVPEKPEEPSRAHVDADDNDLCDTCGESFSDGQDLFGGTELINLTFSDSIEFDSSNKQSVYGLDTMGMKYGSFTTADGYAKFYSTESDSAVESDAYFVLNFQPDGSGVSVNSIDYLTIDLDLWTDSSNTHSFSLVPFGTKADGTTDKSNTRCLSVCKSGSKHYLTLMSQEQEVNFMFLSESVHITYVVEIDHENVANSRVYIYANGIFITSEASPFVDYRDLTYLRIISGKHKVVAGESICLDNFTVATFGSGNGAYSGDISELFGDTSINLTECADSVLYNKNN